MHKVIFNNRKTTKVGKHIIGQFKNLCKILLVLAVIGNTYNYHKLVTTNYGSSLFKKVIVNENMLNELENKLLEHGETVKELSFNPKELMEANVMIFTERAKGSGSVIKVARNYTYILTAAHVVSEIKYKRDKNGRLRRVEGVSDTINIHYGKKFNKKARATVKKIDYDIDVAVLKVYKSLKVKPIKIAESEPNLGESVWSISNPGSHEGLINKGIFSDIEEDWSYVALGGFFGSSGGMCLNYKGEQIGVISTVVIATIGRVYESLTVYNGITRTEVLRKFLKGLI